MFVKRLREIPEGNRPTIMMLSSAGQRGDAARCRELGIRAYLTKPLKRAELLEAIVAVLSLDRVEGRPAQLITRHSLREHRVPLRILLAEDNLVNQRLIVRLLEKDGHAVAVAVNGRDAVTVWMCAAEVGSPFDLVLMDVQMPELDGLAATAAIRAREASTVRRVPVVALTAYAMQGDRERCLAAGMDGYLAKPLVAKDLIELLGRIAAGRGPAPGGAPSERTESNEPAWTPDAALAQVGGDRGLLEEIITIFLDDAPREMAAVDAAIRAGDGGCLAAAAHALRGALGTLAATDAAEVALQLETIGRQDDLAGVSAAFARLECEMGRLRTELVAFSSAASG